MSQNGLKSIFGSEEIGDLVKRSNLDQNEPGVIIRFAPLYGPLNKDTLEKLSPEVQIMIAAAAKSCQKIQPYDRNNDNILQNFLQNPIMQMDDQRSIQRSDTFLKQGNEGFSSDSSSEVRSWFARLVNDDEVLQAVGVGADAVAKMITQSAATTMGNSSTFGSERHEKMFDVTFLNFPDPAEPLFKLQHVRLVAWSHSERISFLQEPSNGITGDYKVTVFTYRGDVISSISDMARSKAIEYARSLFE